MGVTEQEINAGKEEFSHLRLSYLDNKLMLTKQNLFGALHYAHVPFCLLSFPFGFITP